MSTILETESLQYLYPAMEEGEQAVPALRGVDLTIEKGSFVVILGHNGSGKSTLLKIISNVLTPTSGQVAVNGKVAALLELGTGFNMEMSGQENIYLSGMLMGYSRLDMDDRLDAITSFADI